MQSGKLYVYMGEYRVAKRELWTAADEETCLRSKAYWESDRCSRQEFSGQTSSYPMHQTDALSVSGLNPRFAGYAALPS
jgi:hypothetical protein